MTVYGTSSPSERRSHARTSRTHDHDTFDLARDYTDFVGRVITTEYLDQIAM